MTGRIKIIGVGPEGLTGEARQALAASALIVAAPRFFPLAAGSLAKLVPIAPLPAAIAAIASELAGEGEVAVLAGGDPLFFGIGRTLIERFGRDRVTVLPALSSIQLAAARFAVPWDDARLLSLHGRAGEHAVAGLLALPKSIVLTDGANNPARLARRILAYCESIDDQELAGGCRIMVAENLGTDEERLTRGTLAEIAAADFAPLAVMIVIRPERPLLPTFGLDEEEISHSRGLITKNEVRAISLHRLRLPRFGVLWDVGAGSGSVGIEAARLCPGLMVAAVERQPEQLAHIRENIRRFQAYNVRPVAGEAPQALAGRPDPDRVFVGGSGGQLAAIVEVAAQRLSPGGRIVINAVTAKTAAEAPALLARAGFAVSESVVGIVRRSSGAEQQFNPITVIAGWKNGVAVG